MGGDSAGADGSAVWSALADALLMFPLTKPVRLALLNLLCSQQVRLPYLQQSMSVANITRLITVDDVVDDDLNSFITYHHSKNSIPSMGKGKQVVRSMIGQRRLSYKQQQYSKPSYVNKGNNGNIYTSQLCVLGALFCLLLIYSACLGGTTAATC